MSEEYPFPSNLQGEKIEHTHLLSSEQAGWDNLNLIYEIEPAGEMPESIASTHALVICMGDCQGKYKLDGKWHRIEIKQPNITISKTFERDKIDFNGELEYIPFKGFQAYIPPKIVTVNEIVFFHPNSKTLILTDSAFNFDRNFPLVTQLAARILGSYQSLQPSLLEKIAIRDKEAISKSISSILAWDFQRVIMAHGNIVEKNAKEQLAAAYNWVLS